MSLYRISYAAPSVWNSLPCVIKYIQSPTAFKAALKTPSPFKAALKTHLFNPFAAWPRRFLGRPEDFWATQCTPYAQAWKISGPLVKCTFGFGVEGKRLLKAYTWQLDWPPISSSFMAAWERIFLQHFFFGGRGGGWGGAVISGSWLLIKEGIVYILLHVKFWMRFWMMLVVAMKHLYNSDERQGSSGEEEGGDIFPK